MPERKTKRPHRNARLKAIRLLIHDHLCIGAGDYCTGPGREDHARRTVHRYAVRLIDADDVVTEARRVVHEIAHPRCAADALEHCPADNRTVHVLAALADPEIVGGPQYDGASTR